MDISIEFHGIMETVAPKETVLRKAPANVRNSEEFLFHSEYERELEPVILWRLEKAVLLPKGLLYVDGHFHLLNFGSEDAQSRWHRPWRVLKSKGRVLLGSLLKADKQGPYLWITDLWSREYFHWFTESLCRLRFFQSQVAQWSQYTLLLPQNFLNRPYVESSLQMLNWTKVQEVSQPLKLAEVTSLGHLAPQGNYRPSVVSDLRALFFNKKREDLPFRRVYISRKNARKRPVHNEEALEELLKQYHFESYCFEELDFQQQVQVMGQARFLLSNHGAGLTNMLFMPSGGRVLELREDGDAHNNCYYALAEACQLSYFYSLVTKQDPLGNRDAAVVVDLERLEQTLMECFGT